MADLKDRLRGDLTAAMKARDDVRTRTLRMALTSVSKEEVAGSVARELSDDEVMKVLTKEAKRRREAAEAFAAAGREEQAAAERAEGAILAAYLPAQLSDDELAALVAAAGYLPVPLSGEDYVELLPATWRNRCSAPGSSAAGRGEADVSSTAAATCSRCRSAITGLPYLAKITSPCSVTRIFAS